MPTAATTTTTTTALTSSLFRRRPFISPSTSPLPPPWTVSALPLAGSSRPPARRRSISCQVAVTTDVSSSSSSASEEEIEAAGKVGKRVRVKVPVKVYHVMKAPDLDLCGMEGVIKQYVGVWKGKRISANLPFKVVFFLPIEGQSAPIKFFVHLKEDEFEYLPSSD